MASTRAQTFRRRLISVPAFVVAWALSWALLPVVVVVAAIADALASRRWVYVRVTLVAVLYLTFEAATILIGFVLWPARWLGKKRFVRCHFGVQMGWLGGLYRAIGALFGLRTELSGQAALAQAGPLLVFSRHVSQLDVFLPAVTISSPHNVVLRYVLKHALQWSPSIDIVGNRLSNVFVRRGTMAGRREIDNVARLAHNLAPREGVMIFPEGTRFSSDKRRRLLKLLERRGDPALFQQAKTFQHVLPPQLDGPLALLGSNPTADVVFLAHTGFEGIRGVRDLLSGALVGRTIRVHLWRVLRADIPQDEQEQAAWLYAQWARLDAWVEEHLANDDHAPTNPV